MRVELPPLRDCHDASLAGRNVRSALRGENACQTGAERSRQVQYQHSRLGHRLEGLIARDRVPTGRRTQVAKGEVCKISIQRAGPSLTVILELKERIG